MTALFLVTALGKQAIILGLPWLEKEIQISTGKKERYKWRTNPQEICIIDEPSLEPTYNLAISFIKGNITQETKEQWNESQMNKAMLFSYKEDKKQLEEMAKKTLEEKVPVEFHKYL